MKKFISLLVVVAFALSFLPVAKADTVSDMNAQIAALQAQIIALQGDTSTATFCWHTNLKLGMRTADVKLLQEKLGVSNTGYFGVLTLAAVKNFQALNGVPATGFVGELTRAQLNLKYCLGTPPTTLPGVVYPAGCTSSVGYSSTTGVLCATGVVAYHAGCTSATGYSITTGLSCAGVVTYPAGCTSAVGFSSTTGVSCATGVAVGAPTEGSIAITSAPVSVTNSLYGNDAGKIVYAFNAQAKGSDISLKKIDVELLTSTGAAMQFPWKTFTNLSLFDGATKIATLSVTSSSLLENNLGYDYVARFDSLNVAIANNATHTFTVTADVMNNPTAYTGTIGLVTSNAIRFVDSLSLSQYNSNYVTANNVSVANTNTTATVTVTNNVNSPVSGSVKVDASNVTVDVPAIMFDVKSTGTDITVKNATITLDQILGVSAVKLYDGSTLLSSKAASGSVNFDNLNVAVSNGSIKTLTVKLDFAASAATSTIVSNPGVVYLDSSYNSGSKAVVQTVTLTPSVNALTVAFVSGVATSAAATSNSSAYATGTITFTIQSSGTTTAELANGSVTPVVVLSDNSTVAVSSYTVSSNPNQAYSDGAAPATITVTAVYSAPVKSDIVKFAITAITGVTTDFSKFVTNTVYLQK